MLVTEVIKVSIEISVNWTWKDIVGVQPMIAPSSKVFMLKYLFDMKDKDDSN